MEESQRLTETHFKRSNIHWLSRNRLRYYRFAQLHKYLQDNEFVVAGYRMDYSYTESFISLFHFHNESCSIWIHLLSLLAFAWFLVRSLLISIYPNASGSDIIVIVLFLASACYLFLASSLYHLHICVDHRSYEFFGCLDYTGISALICGGTGAITYYILYCDPIMRTTSLIVLGCTNLLGFVGPSFSIWRTPGFRVGRAVLFLSSAAIGLFPIFFYLGKYGTAALPSVRSNFAIPAYFLTLLQYVVGCVIYTSRIPERFSPGRFDYWGASHQIWHVFVTSATVSLYICILGLMKWRLDDSSQCLVL